MNKNQRSWFNAKNELNMDQIFLQNQERVDWKKLSTLTQPSILMSMHCSCFKTLLRMALQFDIFPFIPCVFAHRIALRILRNHVIDTNIADFFHWQLFGKEHEKQNGSTMAKSKQFELIYCEPTSYWNWTLKSNNTWLSKLNKCVSWKRAEWRHKCSTMLHQHERIRHSVWKNAVLVRSVVSSYKSMRMSLCLSIERHNVWQLFTLNSCFSFHVHRRTGFLKFI